MTASRDFGKQTTEHAQFPLLRPNNQWVQTLGSKKANNPPKLLLFKNTSGGSGGQSPPPVALRRQGETPWTALYNADTASSDQVNARGQSTGMRSIAPDLKLETRMALPRLQLVDAAVRGNGSGHSCRSMNQVKGRTP